MQWHTKFCSEKLKVKDHLTDLGIDGVKGKVKLSLCLIKYRAMKTYLLLNYAPRYDVKLGV